MARGIYATGDVPIIRVAVQAGAFIVSRAPGGFTDCVTGLHFPGPKATVDPVTREVVALHDFPDPIQLPTTKQSPNEKDLYEYREIDFFEGDTVNAQDAIRMALDVGILEIVDDEVMRTTYPHLWEKRRKWCFEPRSNVRDAAKSESLSDLYDAARDAHLKAAQEANRETNADAKAAVAR